MEVKFVILRRLIAILGVLMAVGYYLEASPIIESTNEIDLGLVNSECVVSFEVPIKNVGDGELKIFNIVASCKCTKPILQELRISSQDIKKLELTLRVGRYNRAIEENVAFETNDPNHPFHVIKVNVVLPLKLDSQKCYLGCDFA